MLNGSPRLHVAPLAVDSFGDLAGDLAAAYGLVPDPWQQGILDDWLSADEFGLWSSLTCGLACPRQNGKNAILEIRELFGMVGRGEKILHTAHEVKTARKAFKRLQHFFGREVNDRAAKFPELNDRVVELRNVNGQEAIFLDNGGSVEIVARSKNSGRGFTADVLVMDEAQEMSEEDIEALMPTTSAAPLGNPQWIFTGTPPGPKANGEVFTRTRMDALSETPYRICWHEWSACDPGRSADVDLDDQAVWYANNPALGGRLQIAVVEGERSRFSADGFLRERLGVWDEALTASRVISARLWHACHDPKTGPGPDVSFSLDISPMRDSVAFAVAGASGRGGVHIEVISHGPHPGTDWLVTEAKRLQGVHGGQLALVAGSPAGSLIEAMEAGGVRTFLIPAAEYVQACGDFYDAVTQADVLHLDQAELNAAIAGADRKWSGDAWYWARRASTEDITPLVAVTTARWAHLHAPVAAALTVW